jgi:hypothetical protein
MEDEAMDKGDVDKHRSSMSGLKAVEMEKWGRGAAERRYGKLEQPDMKAKDMSQPQFKEAGGLMTARYP